MGGGGGARFLPFLLACWCCCYGARVAWAQEARHTLWLGGGGPATELEPPAASSAAAALVEDPAGLEFFAGVLQRPLLEIDQPTPGQVLNRDELEVSLHVEGYNFPSKLRDSNICLTLVASSTADDNVFEKCFPQSSSVLHFQVGGLVPGQDYVLQATMSERLHVIAVSVRRFRVGGVLFGPLAAYKSEAESSVAVEPVSIQAALAVALARHQAGASEEAEEIYRQVIGEDPHHSDALHLLAIALYQKGDAMGALPHIEKALSLEQEQSASPNFRNTLGECLRALGRLEEAEKQYEKALELSGGNFPLATFNLGLAKQEMGQRRAALTLYGEVLQGEAGVSADMLLEASIRQCDLLSAAGEQRGGSCWRDAAARFPHDWQVMNEYGNALMQAGRLAEAAQAYEQAWLRGRLPAAELNFAVALELLGDTSNALAHFSSVLQTVRDQGLPASHVLVKMATVLPRLIPEEEELVSLRRELENRLDSLLALEWGGSAPTDSSQPLHHGFTLGWHWAFHGRGNASLNSKLSRVYLSFCPPLATGAFTRGSAAESPTQNAAILGSQQARHDVIRVGFLSRFFRGHHPVARMSEGIIARLPRDRFEVLVFSIQEEGAGWAGDPTHDRIVAAADAAHHLSTDDLVGGAHTVRAQKLHILIYPELGMDPTAYFLAFQRLAPIQVVWWGGLDTSGIPSLDYFVSSSLVEPSGAQRHYSEELFLMKGLGMWVDRPVLPERPMDIRGAMAEQLQLPSGYRIYLSPHPLHELHPAFARTARRIVQRDPLGYLLANGAQPEARDRVWGEILPGDRILFYQVSGEEEQLALYRTADVTLDAFPAGGMSVCLQSLAMGTPVITLPGETLAGRLCQAMLLKIGARDCIAESEADYVSTALQLAHGGAIREGMRARIQDTSFRLFHDSTAIPDWVSFLESIWAKARASEERKEVLVA
jgi:protein O-GlcNAc transferase